MRIEEIKRERDAKINDLMDMTKNKGGRAQKLITQEQGLSERSMPLPRPSVNMGQPAALEEIGTRRAAPPKITDISQPSAAQRKTTVMEAPADTSPLIEKKRALKMQLAALGTQPVLPDAAAQKVAHRENITDISGSLKERQKAKEIVELHKIIDSQEPPASKPGDVSRKSLSALSAVKAPEKITEKPLDSVRELPAEKRAPAPEMAIRKPRSVETKDMVQEVRKQALEISGPLKQRKIISTSAPAYPEWAKRKGVEAEVVLKFYVNPQGRVMPEIAVVRTSGYRELDVLGIEALKKWIFAPLANNEPQQDQWGAVTIRYILE
jgi:TonB family protein